MDNSNYGERMAKWEAEQDEHLWCIRFNSAISEQNYSRIDDLIHEGIIEDYEFPEITDKVVLEMIEKHKK